MMEAADPIGALEGLFTPLYDILDHCCFAYEERQGDQLVMVTIGAPTVISVSKA